MSLITNESLGKKLCAAVVIRRRPSDTLGRGTASAVNGVCCCAALFSHGVEST